MTRSRAPNRLYEISYFDPVSFRTARTLFRSESPGMVTSIPTALFLNDESASPWIDQDGDGISDDGE